MDSAGTTFDSAKGAPIFKGDLLMAHMLKWKRSSSVLRAFRPMLFYTTVSDYESIMNRSEPHISISMSGKAPTLVCRQ